jgi:tape measure domain-containing protein
MAQDLRLVLRITGDASGLKAEVVGAKRDVDDLGRTTQRAGGEAAGGLETMAAAATRAAGALAGIVALGAGIYAVARAGDQVNASLGRLAVATGSIDSARDIYSQLYALSLQTGVATTEAAGAFQRFAIAAREAGATRADIFSIVQLMQQAGALAGASTQETASATLQLGQALASGRLQGDELRSILEAMPNLAEALARELGVGLGELRKMGEEGKLTADVVIPALTRASQRMNDEFQKLPPSLSRSMQVLTNASGQLLADLDRAAGLSTFLARALGREGLAGSLDTMRRELGFGSAAENAERDVQRLRGALIQARRQADVPDEFGLNAGRVARAEADLREAEERLAAIRGDAREREAGEDAANAERGRENRRRQSETEITELRETLDRRLRIQREAREREEQIARGLDTGSIDAAAAAALRRDSARREREELAKLGGTPSTREGRDPLASYVRRAEDLTQSLRTPIEIYNEAVSEALRLNDLFVASQGEVGIGAETLARALARARDQLDRARGPSDLDREMQRQAAGYQEIGRIGEQAFDRIGQSITESVVQGKFDLRDLGRVGAAVASELAQAFLRLALINPIKNAAGFGTGTAPTLVDAIGSLFGGGGGAAPLPIDASAGGFLFHTGGIAGHDAAPARAVSATLFAGAPRYHAGGMIGPDEVPAILRRGEGVFTPEQMQRLGPAGGGGYTFAPTINFQGNAGSAEDRASLVQQLRALWLRDLAAAVPGIVERGKDSLRQDVRRMGATRALGA